MFIGWFLSEFLVHLERNLFRLNKYDNYTVVKFQDFITASSSL